MQNEILHGVKKEKKSLFIKRSHACFFRWGSFILLIGMASCGLYTPIIHLDSATPPRASCDAWHRSFPDLQEITNECASTWLHRGTDAMGPTVYLPPVVFSELFRAFSKRLLVTVVIGFFCFSLRDRTRKPETYLTRVWNSVYNVFFAVIAPLLNAPRRAAHFEQQGCKRGLPIFRQSYFVIIRKQTWWFRGD